MDLEEKLSHAGYRMLGSDYASKLIEEILASGTTRHLKAIPVLIARYPVDIKALLDSTTHKELLEHVLTITQQIFEDRSLPKIVPQFTPRTGKFSLQEFKEEFELQQHTPQFIADKEKVLLERETQYYLSQLFTSKEREIIMSVLEGNPVRKTEYEYFSRKTKKKLKAIVHLQRLALSLADSSPKTHP